MESQEIRETLGDVFPAVFGAFMGLRQIQAETIPPLLRGEGVLLVAPTASGKTEAVLAPLLHRALARPGSRPHALWLCPTRALVNDLYERIAGRFKRLDLKVALRTGERKIALDQGAAAILTTPESLDVMLSSRDLADRLRTVEMAVVDEAHLIFGSRRGLQVLMLLQRLERLLGWRLLRAGLSATIAAPESVARWLAGDGPALRVIHGERQREVVTRILGGYPDGLEAACEALYRGLREGWRKILFFTNTRNEADLLAERLAARLPTFPVYLHFSSLPKSYREGVEKRFKEGRRGICVATSTLELGIDIGDIDAAYMYGAPGSITSFLQRAGRSNRRTGRTHVIAIPRTHDGRQSERRDLWTRDVLAFAAIDLGVRQGRLDHVHAPRYWSVLVQQAFSIGRFFGRIGVPPLRDAAGEQVAPFVGVEECGEVLSWLERLGFVSHQSYGDYYAFTDSGWEWLDSLQIWANFSDQSEGVAIKQAGEVLDQVAWANRFLLTRGTLVRVKGMTREVLAVTADAIEVGPPSRGGVPIPLQRLGKGWPISFDIAQALASLPRAADEIMDDLEPRLRPWLTEWLKRFEDVDVDREIPQEPSNPPFYRTFLGGLGNRLVAELVAAPGSLARAADFGIEGPNPEAFQSAALANAAAEITRLAGQLSAHVPTTVHFAMLPASLKADEVASILSDPRIISRIERLPDMEVVPLEPPPEVPW